MGWISKRAHETGSSVNRNPRNNGSSKGPLRVIIGILRHDEGIFDHNYVEFECGHEGSATIGARRGRCRKCKDAALSAGKESDADR